MSDTYTKLFRSITKSTIVSEPLATRWVWVTLLADADASGCVWSSVPGLARLANVSLEDCEAALKCFLSPDPYSRTPANEGRRIEPIPGGWRLLNHGVYGQIRGNEERREYKREWDRKNRGDRPNASHRDNGLQPTTPDNPRHNPTNPTDPTPPTPTPTPEKEQKQKTAPEGDLLEGIEPQVAKDFKALRTKLRAPITATAMAGIQREARKAGLSVQDALRVCCERGWRGFKAEWMHDKSSNGRGGSSGYVPLPGER